MKPYLKSFDKIIILLLVIFISGCASFSQNYSTVMSSSAKQYLEKAAESQGKESQQYQLLAVSQLLNDNNLNDAGQLLRTLNRITLNPLIRQQKYILEAQLALKQNKPHTAIRKLHLAHDIQLLPDQIQLAYYMTSTEAYLHANNLAYSTLARISLNQYTNNDDIIQQNQFIIWHNLQSLSLKSLHTLLRRNKSNLVRGWIKLAIIAEQYSNQPKKLVAAIQSWQKEFFDHPANGIIPSSDTLQSATQLHIPSKVALLLPLHGPFGRMGQAVRDGFMSSFYANARKYPKAPSIKIYDTSKADNIADLYQQAIQEGADFVIGPLTKENAASLASHGNISVPTLVLNYLPHRSTPNNMIQFGLSPIQAAQQAAQQAWQYGVNHILIIYPDSDWGSRVVDAFTDNWKTLNAQVADTLTYSKDTDLSQAIADVLHVSQSDERTTQLKQMLGKSIKVQPRRRQDINGIFLVATPDMARQINPLLRFYYAGSIPVFSISTIYSGYPNAQKDRDLDNIYFDDMPWVLTNSSDIAPLKQQILSAWRSNYRVNNRLYGLGIDAYTLSVMLQRLITLPTFAIHGVTGQLYLTNDHAIYRQLLWAQFKNGIPKPTHYG